MTQQEERHGLLAETARIGTRAGWQDWLHQAGFALRGHRLVRRRQGEEQESKATEARQ